MTAQIWDQLAAIGKSAPGAWDELPPLPESIGILHDAFGNDPLTYNPSPWPPSLELSCSTMRVYTADQIRARDAMWAERLAAAVARERYKWELLTNQVLSDAEAQGVLSEWWEPMQAAIRKGA